MGKESSWIAVIAIAVMTIYGIRYATRLRLPDHMTAHPVIFQENFLSPQVAKSLRDLSKKMRTFPTNVNDLKFYTTKHEHIGEAREISSNGTCDHPFLVPSVNRTHCVLPGRIDIGKHWILSGGVNGIKESYKSMISRVQSFGRYNFDFSRYDVVQELFQDPKFLEMAHEVCPKEKQYLDAFQFNFIIQVPGQTVAAHIDGAYFWGASDSHTHTHTYVLTRHHTHTHMTRRYTFPTPPMVACCNGIFGFMERSICGSSSDRSLLPRLGPGGKLQQRYWRTILLLESN